MITGDTELRCRIARNGESTKPQRGALRVNWIMVVVLGVLLNGCAGVQPAPTQEERKALAPTGKLRAGMLAQPMHATKDPTSGEFKGLAIDLGNELARRLGVPLEIVAYRTVVEIVGSAQSDQWDIIFLGIGPERARSVDFSAPYAQIEMGYLVSKGCPGRKYLPQLSHRRLFPSRTPLFPRCRSARRSPWPGATTRACRAPSEGRLPAILPHGLEPEFRAPARAPALGRLC